MKYDTTIKIIIKNRDVEKIKQFWEESRTVDFFVLPLQTYIFFFFFLNPNEKVYESKNS